MKPKTSQICHFAKTKVVVVIALSCLPALAMASAPSFDCETENGELIGCLSLPSEAKEVAASQTTPSSAQRDVAHTQAQMRLLVESDLSGASAPQMPRGGAIQGTTVGAVNPAMLAAVVTEAQLRRVELFLKSGPASRGDLRVVETRK